ncbi:hypothetical protein INT48_004686 [Thamnidium elegans]|uniref:Uncharacterized protein n=1 Tax=Thamnidium elegans TaxID=101142 RepID=A0A8H7SFK6_9FUNG|nr:hypothetical protein INT48_004686 [Thamnidium elegans]
MKASIAFGKCVNLVALSGYLLNIIGLLDSTSELYIWVSMILLRDSVMSVVGTSITGLIGVIYVLFGSCQSCLKSDEVIAGIEEPSSSTYVFHSPAIHPDLPQYTVKDNTRR